MYTIALVNQKGGVGKSTTAVNLSAGLARLGKRVLLIDLDPQAHATLSLGFQPRKVTRTIYSVLCGEARAEEVILPVKENLWLIPSTIDLAGGEAELASRPNPHLILKQAMSTIADSAYDFAIIDSPPQLGLLNVNSLAWVREVFIPVQCEFFAMHGLALLAQTVDRVKAQLNPALQISAIIPCQYNPRRALTRNVLQELERHFPGRVTRTRIRINVRLAEAPSHGLSIFDYAPESNGAIDYDSLAKEVVELPPPSPWLPGTREVTTTSSVAHDAPTETPEPVATAEPESAVAEADVAIAEPEPSIATESVREPEPAAIATELTAESVLIAPAPAPGTVPTARMAVPAASALGQRMTMAGLRPIVIAKPGARPQESDKGGLTHRILGKLFGRQEG